MNKLNPTQMLAAASDPCTPVEILVDLAISKRKTVLRALAMNPNVPEKILNDLWKDFPECILQNPLLTFWEFTTGDCTEQKLTDVVMNSLYNHLRDKGEELPSHLFTPQTLVRIARFAIRRSKAVFNHLPFEENPEVRRQLVDPHRIIFQVYEASASDVIWQKFATDPDPKVRLQFAKLLLSAPTDVEPKRLDIYFTAARLLAKDSRIELADHLSNCKWLPSDLVEHFAMSPVTQLRENITDCAFHTTSSLKRLAADPQESVRLALAKNCQNPDIHALLVRDSSSSVRLQLAKNPKLKKETLALFNHGDASEIVEAVFLNPRASTPLRLEIFRNSKVEVHRVLLKMGQTLSLSFLQQIKPHIFPNTLADLGKVSNLRREIVEELAADPNPSVRLSIATRLSHYRNSKAHEKNLALVNAFASDPSPHVRLQVCNDPRLSNSSTAFLFNDPDPVIRKKCVSFLLAYFVSERDGRRFYSYRGLYSGKADLILKLATDPDHLVRHAIAKINEAPPAALGILFDDPEPFVREAARSHERWPFGVVLDLAKHYGPKIKGQPICYGETTPSSAALKVLAHSENPFIRKLVARCPRTPKGEIQKLASDPHPVVRETAQLMLQNLSKGKILK